MPTFSELQSEVAERMNLTSATALARIGRSINERHRRVVSSLGLQTASRGAATASTAIGNVDVTFGPTPTGITKVHAITNPAFPSQRPLDELLYDELKLRVTRSGDKPTAWAVKRMGTNSVTITLDSTPATVYTLNADATLNTSMLSGTNLPAFSEDFHDILILHAMSIELDKQEKHALAKEKLKEADDRVDELRYFIAKSAYLQIQQAKNSTTHPANPIVVA